MNYFNRSLEQELTILEKQFPVITITGPRQSGKTTLARYKYPELPYFNLESPDIRQHALTDPRDFLSRIPNGAILDEIQYAPEILSYLLQLTDENRESIRFILTGSNQFLLMNKVTQSLAGRIALLKLLPFSLDEVPDSKLEETETLLYKGLYPAIIAGNSDPVRFYRNYLETYLERDLHQLLLVKDLTQFHKFVRLCAGRIGSIFNAVSLANEVGVSSNTIQSWMSILQASYVVYLLQPYYGNVGKRLIKSPKIYFFDTGLASYLLGIENEIQMSRDPLRGFLFENLVIMELIKYRLNKGLEPRLYYYRDSHQNEIDVVFETAGNLVPVEIKSAKTFHLDFLKGFRHFNKVFSDKITRRVLVYDGKQEMTIRETELGNLRNVTRLVFEPEASRTSIRNA